jgi:predicted PurR-regulated permease PerM
VPPLSERQRLTTLLFYVFVLGLGYFAFQLVRPFLAALGWATVLVVFFYPLYKRAEARYGRTLAAALSTILVTAVVIVPTMFVMSAFVNEALRVIDEGREAFEAGRFAWLETLWAMLRQSDYMESMGDFEATVQKVGSAAAGFLAAQVGAILQNVLVIIFDLIVMLFATFFLFRDGDAVIRMIRNTIPFAPEVRDRMMDQTRDLIYASVVSGMAVAVVQGVMGGVTFALLGLGSPVFWGVVMTLFCLLPLGAWVVWVPAALWLIASGDITRALILTGVGAGVIGAVDNVLRPAMLAGRASLNGLLVLIALLGGIATFGFIGIVLGPIVVATAVGLLEAYTSDEARAQIWRDPPGVA